MDDGLPLRELLNVLRRRLAVILSVVLVLTSLATLYGWQIEPTYTATATIIIEPHESRVVDVEQVLPGPLSEWHVVDNQIDVIRSRALVAQTIDDLGLLDDPEFGAPIPEEELVESTGPAYLIRAVSDGLRSAQRLLVQGVREGLVLLGVIPAEEEIAEETDAWTEEDARDLAIGIFRGKLSVERSSGSVFTIGYTSPDPAKAAWIATAHAKAYVDAQLRNKRDATARANAWLAERLQALQEEVLEAERAVARFQAENQLTAARGTGLSETQLSELNQELIQTRVAKAVKQAQLRLVRDFKASGEGLNSIPEVVASPIISNLRQQEAELLRQEADLATVYGERHPQMVALREEKANLEQRLQEEVDRVLQSLDNELTVIATRERNLEQELGIVESVTALDNQAAVRLRELEREADARRGLYETMLTRYQETRTQEGLLEPDARVIYPAEVPWRPQTPSPKIFAVVGFTASTVFGCMLALLLEQLDKSLRSRRQVERTLGIPCLALVPRATGRHQPPHAFFSEHPRSAYAEGIRALYTMLFANEGDSSPRVVLVTSALPGEGKTSLVSSLAMLSGQLGRRTLLVDLDLRHPRIARQFGFKPAGGLVEVVSGERALTEVLLNEAGLDVLPVHARPADPMALLRSPQLHLLLRALRGQYECVFLDAPPVLGLIDAQILSLYADATLLAVKWERTERDAAITALRALEDVSASVAGAVLTQVDLRKHARYRYGDAGQYYRKYRRYYTD